MPFNSVGVRRHFSSLSAPSRAKPSKYCSNSPSSPCTSPPPSQSVALDENRNAIPTTTAAGEGTTNAELYRQRCRALEAENARLMANQGTIIADSNRQTESHLEEIRCLKEQLKAQRKANAELMRWAQTVQSECGRAKELAREWQKFGQCSNQLMNRELRSNQHRVDQLEAKCGQLMAENVELKRLCLYLDEQRQAGWRQLVTRNESNGNASRRDSGNRDRNVTVADCCCAPSSSPSSSSSSASEDAGRCGCSPSLANSGGRANSSRKEEEERDGGTIVSRVDCEQEQVLRSICSEMHNSMVLMAAEEQQNHNKDESQRSTTNDQPQNGQGQGSQLHIKTPQILTNLSKELATTRGRTQQKDRANKDTARLPWPINLRQFDQSGLRCSGGSETDGLMSTTVLVEDDEMEGAKKVGPMLEVRELCTISEEEDMAMVESTRERLARLEQLGRELLEKDEGEEEPEELYSTIMEPERLAANSKSREEKLEQLYSTINKSEPYRNNKEHSNPEELYSTIVRRRRSPPIGGLIPCDFGGAGPGSTCSSMLAEAGSMLTSAVITAEEHPKLIEEEDFCASQSIGGHRNSTGGSSTSSGAFSGSTAENGGEEGEGETGGGKQQDDDLPPQMPLIFVRCASSMGVVPHRPVPVPRQSSTLPRPPGLAPPAVPNPSADLRHPRPSSVLFPTSSLPSNYTFLRMGSDHRRTSPRPQRSLMAGRVDNNGAIGAVPTHQSSSSVGAYSSSSSAHQQPPVVRIRVRPPPSQLQQLDGNGVKTKPESKKSADVTVL